MSQMIQSTKLRQDSTAEALPASALPSVKRFPFAILYNGSWAYRDGRWIPALLTPALMPGVNGIVKEGRAQANASGFQNRVNSRSFSHRLIFNGQEGRLGEYKDFIHTFPVQGADGLVQHHALICERYSLTKSRKIQRTVDKAWLRGFYDKLMEANIVLPMGYEDLLDHLNKLEAKMLKISQRMDNERDGHALAVLGEQLKKLQSLRKDMLESFEKQFPDAKAEYEAAESECLGADDSGIVYADPDSID